MRWRLSRGTARSRTEQRKCPGAAARPREAIGAKKTQEKLKIGAKGVRGGNLRAEFCHPGRSLVLSRGRESTCSTTAYSQRIQPCNGNPQSPLMRQAASATCAFSFSLRASADPAPSRRAALADFHGVGMARVSGSFAAGRAVSRIRWILERRVLFCACGHGAGAFNIACRFAFGNSPLGSRSCTMPLYPRRG